MKVNKVRESVSPRSKERGLNRDAFSIPALCDIKETESHSSPHLNVGLSGSFNVYYYADLDSRTFEGRTRTAILLKEFLEKQGVSFVDKIEDADLIHVHSSGIADVFKAARWKRKYLKPVIYSLYSLCETEPITHFTNHLRQRYYLGKRKTGFLLSYSAIVPLSWRAFPAKSFEAVIVPSPCTQKKLFLNTKVIRIGVDTDYFKPPGKKMSADSSLDDELIAPAEKIKVAYFGHPSVYKGLIDFVKASALFPLPVETYVFLSCTNEKIEKNLRKINGKVIIKGFTKDIAAAYNEMDIVVAPHRSKLGSIANPLVILEAMACGKAVITTNFPFISEIIKDGAVMIDPGKPQEIASAVMELQNRTLREELGRKARKRILEEFTIEKMFNDYLSLYEKILKIRADFQDARNDSNL